MESLLMKGAFAEALKAQALTEIPVGALIVKDQAIIAAAGNRVLTNYDATAHAEIEVIRKACQNLKTHRLDGCDLYVTLEPCAMCAQAIAHARVRRVYFGAYDVKGGGVLHGARVFDQSTCHHRPEIIGGILEKDCQNLMQDFFQNLRKY